MLARDGRPKDENFAMGTVVAVGPGREKQKIGKAIYIVYEREREPVLVKAGDRVLVRARHEGAFERVTDPDMGDVVLLHAHDVLATIEEEN